MIRGLDRLRHTLGDPNLQWLIRRVRRRLESGLPQQSTITLRNPIHEEREALARLLGKPVVRSGAISVRLSDLEALLRHAELSPGLAEAIAALTGPLVNHRATEAKVAGDWRAIFEEKGGRIHRAPYVSEWLCELEQSRLLVRLSKGDCNSGRALLRQALEIVERLPLKGTPISELAATATGDSHALDAGTPLSAILLRLVSKTSGIEEWISPEGRRSAWASVGVIVDELSAPALVLNLRCSGGTELDRAINLHAEVGEPYRISTRQLLRSSFQFTAASVGRTVYVCENPSVVAAAAQNLGKNSAPLVCIEGQPKTPAHILIRQLRAAGIEIAYHGDFDWPGIRIGNLIVERYGSTPWRFGAADYLEAPKGKVLRGKSAIACWDPGLSAAMTECGKSAHEEAVLPALLNDLACSLSPRPQIFTG